MGQHLIVIFGPQADIVENLKDVRQRRKLKLLPYGRYLALRRVQAALAVPAEALSVGSASYTLGLPKPQPATLVK